MVSLLDRDHNAENIVDAVKDLQRRLGMLERFAVSIGGDGIDHGGLGGLGDDDHTSYLTTARHAALSDGGDLHDPKAHAMSLHTDEGSWHAALSGGDLHDPKSHAHAFTDLTDTPASLAGNGSKLVRVNSGASALEFLSAKTIYEIGQQIPGGDLTLPYGSWGTLVSKALTIPSGGATVHLWAKVQLVTTTYTGTNSLSVELVTSTIARDRSYWLATCNYAYNSLCVHWIGTLGAGSVTVYVKCNKSQNRNTHIAQRDYSKLLWMVCIP